MSDETITFLVLAVVVVVFVWDHLPVAAVALGTALSLWATGVLTLDQSLAGFGDPTVIFIASLFVVSEALDGDGRHLLGGSGADRSGGGEPRAGRRRNAAARRAPHGADQRQRLGRRLPPVVAVMAVRLRRSPSQLLLPLAFGAHAGSLLALTGSPVNVIVSESAEDAGVGRFGLFEFALVGLPLVVGTIAIVVLFGERLLPTRKVRSATRDISHLAHTLVEQYSFDDESGSLVSRRSWSRTAVISS